jgi:hypothetical protein
MKQSDVRGVMYGRDIVAECEPRAGSSKRWDSEMGTGNLVGSGHSFSNASVMSREHCIERLARRWSLISCRMNVQRTRGGVRAEG